eukprot:TRINITY_DN4159_c0_g2_i1.p2 TRINITY_DN4159_c0_g2~~TRINITY_DN4159_c0_g2_i1.p2  ORF type:complete len:169 (+),score=20.46 TRINITY_DN4159_c0_g2_i1:121-627(+)
MLSFSSSSSTSSSSGSSSRTSTFRVRLCTLRPDVWLLLFMKNTNGMKKSANNNNNKYEASSDHRCCAERNLLDIWLYKAIKSGVPPHKRVAWVRRKLRGDIVVWRRTGDGQLGCSVPCVFCQKVLKKFDFRVLCMDRDGNWWKGRLDEDDAPVSTLTSAQKRWLGKVS